MGSNSYGVCNYCSKCFLKNDLILKQVSNESHKIFKLYFCDINCLQCVEKDYKFVNYFDFEIYKFNNANADEDANEKKDYNLMIDFINTYPTFVLYFNNNKLYPKKVYEILNDYCILKKSKAKEKLTKEEKSFIEFIELNCLFDYYKIKLI